MRINLKNSVDIKLLIMLVLVSYLDPTVAFVVSFVYLFYILYKRGLRLSWPQIPGLKLYCLMILINIPIGLIYAESLHSILRDVYYFAPTIIWLFIGCNIMHLRDMRYDKIIKTLYLFSLIISIVSFSNFFLSGDLSFNGLRQNMVSGVYFLDFFWPMMLYYAFYDRQYYCSKYKDIVIILICGLQIFLSLGRISMGLPVIGIICILFLNFKKSKNYKATRFMLVIIVIVLIGLGIAYTIIPKDVTNFFINKILSSTQEINTKQIFNSTEAAMNNWRGYENQVSIEQFLKSNIVFQFLGSGLGTGIKVLYVPYNWNGMIENNSLPLLHSGYNTALIKIGLLGTVSLFIMFLNPIIRGNKQLKKNINKELIEVDIFIITISVMAIISTYVVRGPIQQGVFLGWALLISVLYEQKRFFDNVK